MPDDASIDRPAFAYTIRSERKANTVSVTYDYKSKTNSVAPADVRAYLAGLDEVHRTLRYRIERPTAGSSSSHEEDLTVIKVGAALIGFGFVAFFVVKGASSWRQGRRRRAFARIVRPDVGHTADTAVRVADKEELDRRLVGNRCGCGQLFADAGERTVCRYDGRSLTVVSRHCPECARTQTLYFDVATVAVRSA
jgi:hypothetical protein